MDKKWTRFTISLVILAAFLAAFTGSALACSKYCTSDCEDQENYEWHEQKSRTVESDKHWNKDQCWIYFEGSTRNDDGWIAQEYCEEDLSEDECEDYDYEEDYEECEDGAHEEDCDEYEDDGG